MTALAVSHQCPVQGGSGWLRFNDIGLPGGANVADDTHVAAVVIA
ncbi:MAG: hypothetical protein ACT4NL_10665 [Pseudomarimonas sp.]